MHVSFPANLRKSLSEDEEAIYRTTVASESPLDYARLRCIKFPSATGIRIIMILHMRQRICTPDKHIIIFSGYVLIGRGSNCGFSAPCEVNALSILKKIVCESGDVISWITVHSGSLMDKILIANSHMGTVIGLIIFVIKHSNRWIYHLSCNVLLHVVEHGRCNGDAKLYDLYGVHTDEMKDFENLE